LAGDTGDLIGGTVCGLGYFVWNFHDNFLFVLIGLSFVPRLLMSRIHDV
jgi:hypothetical protein